MRYPTNTTQASIKAPHRAFYGLSIADMVALAKRCIESDDKDSD
jgi:hypothetical protein